LLSVRFVLTSVNYAGLGRATWPCSAPWRGERPGVFEYARLKLYINEILEGLGDVVNRRTLKPLPKAFRGTRWMPSENPDNIERIDAFTAGMDFETFAADRKTVYAVVRALEIVYPPITPRPPG